LIAGDAGQQRDQAHKIYPALQFRSGMLKIDRGRDARLGSEVDPARPPRWRGRTANAR
jgi:hypothetical protein